MELLAVVSARTFDLAREGMFAAAVMVVIGALIIVVRMIIMPVLDRVTNIRSKDAELASKLGDSIRSMERVCNDLAKTSEIQRDTLVQMRQMSESLLRGAVEQRERDRTSSDRRH